MNDLTKLLQALTNIEASLDRVYRFLGCPKPSENPEGFERWLAKANGEDTEPAVEIDAEVAYDREMDSRMERERERVHEWEKYDPPRRWGEVYDGGQ